MDSQTKVNVDFKPAKRMKKRRELDALVNGKQPPSFRGNGRMRNGKHELLRNDSDSSEVEEFILPEKSLIRKSGHSTFCSVCVNVCWGFLLFMCLVGIGGLVWMCVQLKKDVDQLRVQLDRVEMQNSNFPGEMRHSLSELEKTNVRLSQLESGDQGIERLRENFTLLAKQISDLEATTKMLSQSVANAPQLLALQSVSQQVKDLSKNVAELGSNLQTMQQNVNQLIDARTEAQIQRTDIDARLRTLQLATNEQKSAEHKDVVGSSEDITRLDDLIKGVNLMNLTFYTYIQDLRAKYNSEHVSVLELFNFTNLLNTRVTFLEVRSTVQPLTQDELASAVTASIQNMLEELHNTSRDQDLEIKMNKAQLDSVITLLQAQITGHESKISSLTNRINWANISVADLENTVDLKVEMLNAKYQLLLEKLKIEESGRNFKSTGSEAEPTPVQPADVTADHSSSTLSSSTSSTLALSFFISNGNQNLNMSTAQNGSSPLN